MKTRNLLVFVIVAALAAGAGIFISHQRSTPQPPEARALAKRWRNGAASR